MNRIQHRWSSVVSLMAVVVAAALGVSWCAAQTAPPPTPAQEVPEVLTRGPVHEAFAEPVNIQKQTGLQVKTQPPPVVQESPPAAKPQGQNVIWAPGYWSWDTDRNTYIWVSGCWRMAPPSMAWIPGYWNQVPGGWEWVPGFWSPAGAQELTYLPPPPDYDLSPTAIPAPAPDYIWVPPCWYWHQTRYILRAGYWLAPQPGWVWVPTHHICTPRGYVIAEGHWDYPLETRGVLFAPVCFPQPYYLEAGFVFTPGIVVSFGLLNFGLFVHPHYCHYYFGDYYDAAYVNIGIYPWFHHQHSSGWYNPIHEYQHSQHILANPQWENQQQLAFTQRRANMALRPARTYQDMEAQVARLDAAKRREATLVRPLADVLQRPEAAMKFDRLSSDQRASYVRQANADAKYREERSRWENSRALATDPRGVGAATDRGGTTTPRETVARPVDRGGTVIDRRGTELPRETVARPVERSAPGVVTERRGMELPRETVARPVDRGGAVAPSRDVRLTQPERVRIPTAERVERPAPSVGREISPPSRPTNERAAGRADAPVTRPDDTDRSRR